MISRLTRSFLLPALQAGAKVFGPGAKAAIKAAAWLACKVFGGGCFVAGTEVLCGDGDGRFCAPPPAK